MKISSDTAKCKGQSPDGSQVCRSRDKCLRYVAPTNEYQAWADFWLAGDDCIECKSLTLEAE